MAAFHTLRTSTKNPGRVGSRPPPWTTSPATWRMVAPRVTRRRLALHARWRHRFSSAIPSLRSTCASGLLDSSAEGSRRWQGVSQAACERDRRHRIRKSYQSERELLCVDLLYLPLVISCRDVFLAGGRSCRVWPCLICSTVSVRAKWCNHGPSLLVGALTILDWRAPARRECGRIGGTGREQSRRRSSGEAWRLLRAPRWLPRAVASLAPPGP